MKHTTHKKHTIIKWVNKIGFFRLTLVPISIIILITAYQNNIIGMGIVGVIVLGFGIVNKCLLMGKCVIPDNE